MGWGGGVWCVVGGPLEPRQLGGRLKLLGCHIFLPSFPWAWQCQAPSALLSHPLSISWANPCQGSRGGKAPTTSPATAAQPLPDT